ncbi:WD40/YVTN/BNR-like repeat-containing protein [Granulicella mallensis]|nr:hypothetical protein [Granulicella mallensis]
MRVPLLLTTLAFATAAHAQWTLQDAHTTASLRGIHSLGHGIAWASGTEGTILRTEDNGTHWQHCTIPPNAEHLDFRGIQAFDNKTAIVMSSGKGDLSRLYQTTDGCQTWTLVLTNPDPEGFWDALTFDPGSKPKYVYGMLVGDPVNGNFVIYRTTDQGNTWQPLAPTTKQHLAVSQKDESLFAASNSAAVMSGPHGQIAFVTGGNGGARFIFYQHHDPCDCKPSEGFSDIKLPIASSESAGAFSIARRQTIKGYILDADFMVVGGDYRRPDSPSASVFVPHRAPIITSLSRRAIPSLTPPHGYRSAVAYDTSTKTWITVGPNGTDISTDDGRNWRALTPGPSDAPDADKNWNALSLPFAVGPHGRIGFLRDNALAPHK